MRPLWTGRCMLMFWFFPMVSNTSLVFHESSSNRTRQTKSMLKKKSDFRTKGLWIRWHRYSWNMRSIISTSSGTAFMYIGSFRTRCRENRKNSPASFTGAGNGHTGRTRWKGCSNRPNDGGGSRRSGPRGAAFRLDEPMEESPGCLLPHSLIGNK